MPIIVHLLKTTLILAALATPVAGQSPNANANGCRDWIPEEMRRNPTAEELRCRFGAHGPGRFGLLSYADVPVYQPATPMPGTHIIGVPGQPRPRLWESYEEWEWRVLRTDFGPSAHQVHTSLELLHPFVASRVKQLEQSLVAEGIPFRRRESWRSAERQAYLFQRGRSRPGALATGTLTSWHCQVDERGRPAGRAVDYEVAQRHMVRFHELAEAAGLSSFGADSFDPGHVFLPDPTLITPLEVAMLRTLPRVPEVTLATGLPVDRLLPPGGREALREAARRFAGERFVPVPQASIVRAGPVVRGFHREVRQGR